MGGGPSRPEVHPPPAQGPAVTGVLLLLLLLLLLFLLLLLLFLLLLLLLHVGADAEHAAHLGFSTHNDYFPDITIFRQHNFLMKDCNLVKWASWPQQQLKSLTD